MKEEYNLETIQDIANVVTPENIDDLMRDLRASFILYLSTQILSDMASDKNSQERSPLKISSLKWTPDAKRDVCLTISSNDNSQERIEFKLTDARTRGERLRDDILRFLLQSEDVAWAKYVSFFEDKRIVLTIRFGLDTDLPEGEVDGGDIEDELIEFIETLRVEDFSARVRPLESSTEDDYELLFICDNEVESEEE